MYNTLFRGLHLNDYLTGSYLFGNAAVCKLPAHCEQDFLAGKALKEVVSTLGFYHSANLLEEFNDMGMCTVWLHLVLPSCLFLMRSYLMHFFFFFKLILL